MAKLKMTISHSLTQNEALERIKVYFGKMKSQLTDEITDLSERWDGNTGKLSFLVMGFPVFTTIRVRPSVVKFSSGFPPEVLLFRDDGAHLVTEEQIKNLLT